MKKILPFIVPLLIFLAVGFYNITTYLDTTIYYVQTVPPESLAIGHDRSLHVGDSVTVIGRVVAPPLVKAGIDNRVLLRGTTSRTAYIQDTLNNPWGGIIVRQASITANTQFELVDSGAVIRVSGRVQEFPNVISSSVTQIDLDTNLFVTQLPTIKKRPVPIQVHVSDFDSLGDVKFLTGEKYEGMYVKIDSVTIGPQSPLGSRNIRSLIDANGNYIYLRDFSNFFSIYPNDTGFSPWNPPSIGATVDSIKGVIINSAYADGNGGLYPYVIVPIYPNDLKLGNTPPFISNVTRIPGVPKPPDSVQVNVTVVDTLDSPPLSVTSVQLFYRINRGQYIMKSMSNSGNIFYTKMPPEPLGTLVEYFVKATDNQGAVRLNPSDTSRSTYFYFVRSSDTMSIRDIQYTPNNGGYSAYNGFTVSTTGIVTCDTSDIPYFYFQSEGGTQTSPRRVIIQDPAIQGGWSGVWINGLTTGVTDPLVRGQKVMVRGEVEEYFGVTRINVAAGDVHVISSNNQLPAFQLLTPGDISDQKSDGDTTAEKWESVLVRFDNPVSISCLVASGSSYGCFNTLPLPDSTFRRNYGELYVIYPSENIEARVELQDGNHDFTNGWDPALANYYNPNLPGHLLYQWNGFTSLQGVLYYSYSHYKLVPRKNSDFGSVIGVKNNQNELPTVFWLGQNYPNPFNPITTIKYNIPFNSKVTLKVYNLLGQEVKTLVNGIQNRGRYEVKFDGTNLASGIYFYILNGTSFEGQKFTDTKKMVLVK